MSRVYTLAQQNDPNHIPNVGDWVEPVACWCFVVGPEGKNHWVMKYNNKCPMHGPGGFTRDDRKITL